MTKKAVIATINEYIQAKEEILRHLKERNRLLNISIPQLEKEIQSEKERLRRIIDDG